MPNHCYQEVSIIGPWPIVSRLHECAVVSAPEDRRFCDVVIPIPLSEVNNWYDWCIQNWGTKWDVHWVEVVDEYEKSGDLASFTFRCCTAWAPPVPVWDRLVQELDCIVTADYHDEGGLFEGRYNCGDKRWKPEEVH